MRQIQCRLFGLFFSWEVLIADLLFFVVYCILLRSLYG